MNLYNAIALCGAFKKGTEKCAFHPDIIDANSITDNVDFIPNMLYYGYIEFDKIKFVEVWI